MFRKRKERKARIEKVEKLERRAHDLEVDQGKKQTYDVKPVRLYEDAAHEWESLGYEGRARQNHLHALGAARKAYEKSHDKDLANLISELEEEYVPKNMGPAWTIITIAGLGVGIFFLSPNITGNAIAEMTTKTTSLIGAGLLIVGLVAGFFWLKDKK